ncbi:MAG TPA: hypothetical protein V6C76_01895 [Drouetiella sp.]
MPNQFERAHHIAEEMTHGDIRGAANNLHRELEINPNEALNVIRMANQEAAQHNSPNHIEVRGNQVLVEDGYRNTAVMAGVLNFNNCYGNSVYDRQPPCNQPYEQPVPQPPPVYEGQQGGLSPGAALGIGIIGGAILDRVLRNDRHEPPRYDPRHRW